MAAIRNGFHIHLIQQIARLDSARVTIGMLALYRGHAGVEVRQAPQAHVMGVHHLFAVRIGVRQAGDHAMLVKRFQKAVRTIQFHRKRPAADAVRAAQHLFVLVRLRIAQILGVLSSGLRGCEIRSFQMQTQNVGAALALQIQLIEAVHKIQQILSASGQGGGHNAGGAVQHMAAGRGINGLAPFHEVVATRAVTSAPSRQAPGPKAIAEMVSFSVIRQPSRTASGRTMRAFL